MMRWENQETGQKWPGRTTGLQQGINTCPTIKCKEMKAFKLASMRYLNPGSEKYLVSYRGPNIAIVFRTDYVTEIIVHKLVEQDLFVHVQCECF